MTIHYLFVDEKKEVKKTLISFETFIDQFNNIKPSISKKYKLKTQILKEVKNEN